MLLHPHSTHTHINQCTDTHTITTPLQSANPWQVNKTAITWKQLTNNWNSTHYTLKELPYCLSLTKTSDSTQQHASTLWKVSVSAIIATVNTGAGNSRLHLAGCSKKANGSSVDHFADDTVTACSHGLLGLFQNLCCSSAQKPDSKSWSCPKWPRSHWNEQPTLWPESARLLQGCGKFLWPGRPQVWTEPTYRSSL